MQHHILSTFLTHKLASGLILTVALNMQNAVSMRYICRLLLYHSLAKVHTGLSG